MYKINSIFLATAGLLVGLFASFLLIILLNYFNVINFSSLSPWLFGWLPERRVKTAVPTATTSTTPAPQSKLDTCDLKKEGNPLVKDVRTLQIEGRPVVVGVFRGNINSVTRAETGSARVEVISPKGEQSHTLTVLDEKGTVYDAVGLKDLGTRDLKPGQTVEVSFNCFREGNIEEFKVTRVAITGM